MSNRDTVLLLDVHKHLDSIFGVERQVIPKGYKKVIRERLTALIMASAVEYLEEDQEADLPPSIPVLAHLASTPTTSMDTVGSDAKVAHPLESGA